MERNVFVNSQLLEHAASRKSFDILSLGYSNQRTVLAFVATE